MILEINQVERGGFIPVNTTYYSTLESYEKYYMLSRDIILYICNFFLTDKLFYFVIKSICV